MRHVLTSFLSTALVAIALVLGGCSGSGGGSPAATKTIGGGVTDIATGLPVANATVSAYAIDAGGAVAPTPLGVSAKSDGHGNYTLAIPAGYSGGVLVQASVPTSPQGGVNPAPGATFQTVRAVVAAVPEPHTIVMLNLATELATRYIETNHAASFTPDSIAAATAVLEPFMGVAFDQVAAPAGAATPVQQQLAVMTAAINSLVGAGSTLDELVTVNPATGVVAMGEGALLTQLEQAADSAQTTLAASGVLPTSYVVAEIVPIAEPATGDTTPPAAPAGFTASATPGSVILGWSAVGDATAYQLYRDGLLCALVTTTSYTDTAVAPGTSYHYELRARDAAGNTSAAAVVSIAVAAVQTYTISGQVTQNGAPVASATIILSGSGSAVGVTDANGNYSFTGARPGTYLLTPVPTLYSFTPVNRSVTIASSSASGVNFAAQPGGTISGGVTFPPGTIIGGITYPNASTVGGVTYTTATVIGGVTYPTGTVLGGILYPNGVVIGGVSYPAGTVVGGVAFPPGTVTSGYTFGTGLVFGGVTYPAGIVGGAISYPSASTTGSATYPSGTVVGGISFPTSTVIGGVTYPPGTIIGGTYYPTGTVVGGVSHPDGVVIGGVAYPPGTVVGGIAYPNSAVDVTFIYYDAP